MNFKNWSGIVQFTPHSIYRPKNEVDLITFVKQCHAAKRRIRVVGAGHSFTRLIETDEALLSLEYLQGLIAVDEKTLQATVWAGTQIKILGRLLARVGLAQANLGDIDVQSIAGAISTGTHGSGVTLGSLATQVVGLRLITAMGDIIDCSPTQEPALFKAAQVSLGLLGVITRVTLQCVPAYTLGYQWYASDVNEVLADLETLKQNRNFEFFWLPHTERALVKIMNITQQPAQMKSVWRRFNENVLENAGLWVLNAWVRRFPTHSRQVARIMAALVSGGQDVTASHETFATLRLVKFQEMEYNIPAEHFVRCLQEIKACISANRITVVFPVECRFVAADDIPLSPAYQRPSAYIAVHQFKGMPHEAYFAQVEAIFRAYGGRPHWGKLHTCTVDELRTLYPCWEPFMKLRAQLDPDGLFVNSYLRPYVESFR